MLRWDWDKKIGEMKLASGHKINLYQGNAYLIMISEDDKDDTYQMFGFFTDKMHMNNCLGLNKRQGYKDNMYEGSIKEITIDKTKYKYTKELVSAFVNAFNNITINIISGVA